MSSPSSVSSVPQTQNDEGDEVKKTDKPSPPPSASAILVVLGDVGRSPRMCYHAISLAHNGVCIRDGISSRFRFRIARILAFFEVSLLASCFFGKKARIFLFFRGFEMLSWGSEITKIRLKNVHFLKKNRTFRKFQDRKMD